MIPDTLTPSFIAIQKLVRILV
ncbi:hypothetical protein CY0110_18517 [Crocosphaera chwakensis CCY0110]|uniref:Uncharacterized protein n=1 Tax=Crocosphaera chwakensis CCY0110 TaxID=391612 RepID=A3IJ35_9CHRO|nr:hypothetical protein CY0110_18517 [Crocosphaera chwakensis CCY0110]